MGAACSTFGEDEFTKKVSHKPERIRLCWSIILKCGFKKWRRV